ncbi:MAG: fused MFS/spermidine synthase, partial [Planctomycetota bacterium JB042]
RVLFRSRRPFVWLAGLQLGIAAAGLAVVPLFDALPFRVTGWLAAARESFWQVQAVTFGLFLLVMLVPTLLMGAMFPFASRVAGDGADAGRTVGTVYAANTFGAIVGAAAAGFALVPWLGVRGALLAAVVTNLAVFALFAEAAGAGWARRRAVAAGGLAVGLALVALSPSWDPARTATGAFANARRLPPAVAASPERLAHSAAQAKIVFHEDGRDTTVTVLERPDGERILSVNGKPDASSREDLSTQLLLGHVPMLLHPDPNDVLVIGLASGITLAATAKHDAASLQCAEIAPSVVRACRMFEEANDHVLDDERVEVLTTDGRNHLRFTDRTYDVVISEPSNPWIVGIGDLFTLEFFRIVSDRLTDGGVACIWVETYNIDEESLRSVARTVLEVFPDGALWNIGPFDFELVGVKGGIEVDAATLVARAEAPAVAADLGRIGIDSAAGLLARQVCGPEALRRFADGAPLHTDDNALLEFRAPRILFRNRGEFDLLETLEEARAPTFDWLDGPGADALRAEVAAAVEAERRRRGAEIHLFRAAALGNDPTPAAAERMRDELRKAAALAPDHPDLVAQLEEGMALATEYERQGRTPDAITTYRRLLSVFPDDPRPANDLAWLLATHPNERFRDGEEAVRLAEKAVAATGGDAPNELDTLAAAYAEAGRFKDARVTISKAIARARAEGNPRAATGFEAHQETIRRGEAIRSGSP